MEIKIIILQKSVVALTNNKARQTTQRSNL
jgi:hypothetical protein